MSNDKLPQSVTAKKLVDSGATLVGAIAADRLPRVADAVEVILGKIEVELAFSRGADYKAIIDLQIAGDVHMQCQRCLTPVTVALKIKNSLTIVAHDEEAKSRIKDLEPVMLEEGILDIDTLVEEEILLSLPLIAMHPLLDQLDSDTPAFNGSFTKGKGEAKAKESCDLSLEMVAYSQFETDYDLSRAAGNQVASQADSQNSDQLRPEGFVDQVTKIERRSEAGMDNPFDVLKTLKTGGGQE